MISNEFAARLPAVLRLLLATFFGVVAIISANGGAAAAPDNPWPSICIPLVDADTGPPSDRSTYEVKVMLPIPLRWFAGNSMGGEAYWYWNEPEGVRVVVHSHFSGTLAGQGRYEHCREEHWRRGVDGNDTLDKAKAINDDDGHHTITIERVNDGFSYTYQHNQNDPKSIFVADPTSIASMTTDAIVVKKSSTLMDVFDFKIHEKISVQPIVTDELVRQGLKQYRIEGGLQRVLWYDATPERHLARLCGREAFGAIIEVRRLPLQDDSTSSSGESCSDLF